MVAVDEDDDIEYDHKTGRYVYNYALVPIKMFCILHWKVYEGVDRLHALMRISECSVCKSINRMTAGSRLPRCSHGFFLLSPPFQTHFL